MCKHHWYEADGK